MNIVLFRALCVVIWLARKSQFSLTFIRFVVQANPQAAVFTGKAAKHREYPGLLRRIINGRQVAAEVSASSRESDQLFSESR